MTPTSPAKSTPPVTSTTVTRPKSSERRASAAQLVRGVERGDLVALRERRIVEDRLEKVVEPAAEPQDGLADVDQLGRARAQAVHGQQPPILAMEEHLDEPAPVAEDLTARD